MRLTAHDLAELTAFRRLLHQFPEVSGDEAQTAARIAAALAELHPDQIVTNLGGHGVAAVFGTGGPTVMFRAELDGLPITEISDAAHRSTIPGRGHLCGHDGHMTILLGLGRLIARNRPKNGRVILMFQPAEEDGAGAGAVMADPNFAALRPDWAFALHNMPRLPLGQSWLRAGAVNCASLGLRIVFSGKTAHASLPETGRSPARAMAALIPALMALGIRHGDLGGPLGGDFRLVTITHALLGEAAFGIAPGLAEVWATLRTLTDAPMAEMLARTQAIACDLAAADGLDVTFAQSDSFAACTNDPAATVHLQTALDALGMTHSAGELPMRWSEDFGRFGQHGTRSAMLFLGAGEGVPDLHNPDYDFPDALIPLGAAVFDRVLRQILA